ncbi:MAG: twin-arginine translocase TatA/TatE family subunit [Sphingomicrobium sp.]
MFGVDSTELIIVALAALLFIGPKELPQTMRAVGRWVGKVRGMARHFTSGIESVIREAELEEMERKWREENDRIMREFPSVDATPAVAAPVTDTEPGAAEQPALQAPNDQSHLPPEQRELP